MSEQQQAQQQATPAGYQTWRGYWTAQGMPWRTKPEIGKERQRYLAERRAIMPDSEQSIYPFKGIKLDRADVEWLLATHESKGKIGPVQWDEEEAVASDQRRVGLDLRGCDLRGATSWEGVNLSGLPLSMTQAGLLIPVSAYSVREGIKIAVPQLQKAREAAAHLELVDFSHTDLRGANLFHAHLEYATFAHAHLEGAYLTLAYLNHALFYGTYVDGADLRFANMSAADLIGIRIGLNNTQRGRRLFLPLDLRGVAFDRHSALDESSLADSLGQGYARLAYVDWGAVNLVIVDWAKVRTIGDERIAQTRMTDKGRRKDSRLRCDEYQEAAQANQRLAVVLRNQGLSEPADRFAYRAQVCQRKVYRFRGNRPKMLGSLLLESIAGYGYKPGRSFVTYMLVILGFAAAFFILGTGVLGIGGHDAINSPTSALVFSVTSFHGRGFFPGGGLALDDPITVLAALEAIIGLFIEITFIATFTQRFFAR